MGPSGCGKSTLLRVVAGLQQPDEGMVTWRGRDITDLPPHQRGFGLMFQDYALFPHRPVAENVAFGLRMQRWDAAAIAARVDEMLAVVGLADYGQRPIHELSGGEQQRVALARTLAPRPGLVMLDEPLGSLDRTLRERLVTEMRNTFERLKVTALYVTHDQDEAFTIGESIAVMRQGRIEAEGTAAQLWSDPQTASVARLIGHDNVLDAAAARRVGIDPGSAPAVVVPADAVELTATDGAASEVVAVGLRAGRLRTEVDVAGVRLVSTAHHALRHGDVVDVLIPVNAVIPLRG